MSLGGIIIIFKKYLTKWNYNIILILVFMLMLVCNNSLAADEAVNLSIDVNNKLENYHESKEVSFNYPEVFIPQFNVRGIYVTGWVAGLDKRMNNLIELVNNTILNTMVIDVKDNLGYLSYSSEVEMTEKINASKKKISDIKRLLTLLEKNNIYTIGRIVVFKDALLAKERPDLALEIEKEVEVKENKSKDIKIIKENVENNRDVNIEKKNQNNKYKYSIYKSKKWVDPSNREVWNYNIELAREALKLGFDEVQFDYIRYPALKGNLSVFNKNDKNKIINDFVVTAQQNLKDLNKPISIDVFGMTTSVSNGLGIGQDYERLSKNINIISPMVYPSHYSAGVFGLSIPEKKPYETVYKSMDDALKKSNANTILRPWLQDFSINYNYYAIDVINQIKAVESLGINEWLLWNPSSRYTQEALESFRLERDHKNKRYNLVPSY